MTKMLISEAVTWWFRHAEKLSDGSAKIFEKDNNRLAEEIAKLEANNIALTKSILFQRSSRKNLKSLMCKVLAKNKRLEEDLDMERTMRVGAQRDYFYQKERADDALAEGE